MKKYVTEFDELMDALSRCNLNEEVIPVKAGCVIHDVDSYNKIQRLLEIDEFEPSHKFLYNLDVDQMSDRETAKVNQLYKLAQDRGFIDIDEPEDDVLDDDIPATDSETIGGDYSDQLITKTPINTKPYDDQSAEPEENVAQPVKDAPQITSAYTIYYSAMKDGKIKTGECESNAMNPKEAKADCINKLYRAGFDNITVLAVDVNDEDYRDNEIHSNPLNVTVPSNSISLESDDEQIEEGSETLDEDDLEEAANEKSEDAETFFNKVKNPKSDDSEDDDSDDDDSEDNDTEDDDTDDESDDDSEDVEESDNKNKLAESMIDIDLRDTPDYLEALKVMTNSYLKNRKPGPIEVTVKYPRIANGADAEYYYAIISNPDYGITSFDVLSNDNVAIIRFTFANLAKFANWVNETDYDEEVKKLFINGKEIKDPINYLDTLVNPNVFEDDNDIDDQIDNTDESSDLMEDDTDDTEQTDTNTDTENNEETDVDTGDAASDNADNTDEKSKDNKKTSAQDDEKNDEDQEEVKLTPSEKKKLTVEYTKSWKEALTKCRFKVPFNELTLEQKITFFETLSNIWGDKPDSTLFLKDRDSKKLSTIKVRI